MPGRRRDDELWGLFTRAGRNLERATTLLRDLLADYPEQADLARELLLCEQDGDRITHDTIHRLRSCAQTSWRRRPAIDPREGHALATALDDVVDYAEQAADALSLYSIEAPMQQAVDLATVLVAAGAQVAEALRRLRAGTTPTDQLVEIHRLENEGDRIVRDGVASLFADGIDPMVVIRWKDIFEALEQAVDACETVAHLLEGMTLSGALHRH